jgi:predicted PurR-regulated permease PerM
LTLSASSRSSRSLPLLTACAVFLTIATLYVARAVLVPLALAVLFTFVLTPLVVGLERCRLGRVPAVVLVLAVCFLATGAVGWLVTGQLMQISDQLPNYTENIHKKIQLVRGPARGGLSNVTATVKDVSRELSKPAAEPLATPATQPEGARAPAPTVVARPMAVEVAEPPSNVLQDLRTLLGPLVGPLKTGGLVLVFVFFMLVRREDLRNRLIRLVGQGRLTATTEALDDAAARLGRYLLLQFLVNTTYGALFALGLHAIGVPQALLWGLLSGLLRFVPYVGTLTGAAFPMVLAAAVFPGWSEVLWTFALFLSIELSLTNVIEPWLYGSHTGISSLAILVAAVFWGLLWGPIGLLLSTPLTVCLVVLGRYVPPLKFLEVVLGDEPVLAPEAQFYQRLLAKDQEEARDVAEAYLKDHPLGIFYDAVLIPALALAERDRHMDDLDEARTAFLCQSTKELIEELGERPNTTTPALTTDTETTMNHFPSDVRILCLPARDEADEIVGMTLAQLLQRAGFEALSLPIGAVTEMLDQVAQQAAQIVCVSALPPLALGHARSLCRRLRLRFPELKVILGVWHFQGGAAIVRERVGPELAEAVGTTLAEVMVHVRHLVDLSSPSGGLPEAPLSPRMPGGAQMRWSEATK